MGSGAPVAHELLLAKSKTMHILSVKPLGIERENCIRQQYPCGLPVSPQGWRLIDKKSTFTV